MNVNTHKELFKQDVQDIQAIRKAKYPLIIDTEQAMFNAIEAKLLNLSVLWLFSAFCILVGETFPFHSIPVRILATTVAGILFLHWSN